MGGGGEDCAGRWAGTELLAGAMDLERRTTSIANSMSVFAIRGLTPCLRAGLIPWVTTSIALKWRLRHELRTARAILAASDL